MNIVIPLCGKGERFLPENKPFVKVFHITILQHVISSLQPKKNNIYIIVNDRTYHPELESYGTIINIHKETAGAAETVYCGLRTPYIGQSAIPGPILIADGDNFYSADITENLLKNPHTNQIVCFEDDSPAPIFSYIQRDMSGYVAAIKEKERISLYANTGAYYFASSERFLYSVSQVFANKKYYFKGEPYISSVIAYMLDHGDTWNSIVIPKHTYHSLGTPHQVKHYRESAYCFLFDLDGTLVYTDDVYYEVWKQILSTYNIFLTKELYVQYIHSNSDIYVKKMLLTNVPVSVEELSALKDTYFAEHIGCLQPVPGSVEFLRHIHEHGHRISVVTNANRPTAELILRTIGIDVLIDNLVIGGECVRPKPYADPYQAALAYYGVAADKAVIFEDSHNGLLAAKAVVPRCIVGIGPDSDGLKASGAQLSYSNFRGLSIGDILAYTMEKNVDYIPHVRRSLAKRFKELEEVAVNPVTLKGGFIADVYSVSFKNADVEHRCIFKVENQNETPLNHIAHDLQLYSRENYFYESVSAYVPVSIPDFYGLVRDDDMRVLGILLGDLRGPAMELNLNLNKEPVESSLAVIDALAKMHAAFWGKGLTDKFTTLKKNNDPLFQPAWGDFVSARIGAFITKWGHMLTPTQVEFFQTNADQFPIVQNALSAEPLTLIHGDVKSPNIFFKRGESGLEPFFIDWQYIAYGKGVQDIVFFMIESFDKESIRKNYGLFKHYYYVKLLEYGVKDYTVEDYDADFKNAVRYFPYFVAIWFGTTPNEDLIDVNFPYFFIDRLVSFYEYSKLIE
jgi:HAD superfamily hydrolase (TIGR01509 family)